MRIRLMVTLALTALGVAGCGGGGGNGTPAETRRVFVVPHVLESSGRLGRVATGDLDGDGVFDLLAFNADLSSLDLLASSKIRESPSLPSRNKGRFVQGSEAYRGVSHSFVWDSLADMCTCDLDGDGALDVVAAGGSASQLGVWRCDPDNRGSLLSPLLLDTTVQADRVAVGDLDGDGDLDLVCLEESTGQLRLFHQSSSSPLSFVVGNDPPAVGECRGLVLVDMNRDGLMDCVTNGYGRDVLVIFDQDAARVLQPRDVATGLSTGRAMGVGDVDCDGWPDVVLTSEDGLSLVCLHQRPAQPGFFDVFDSPLSVAVHEEGLEVAQIAIDEPGLHVHVRESPTRPSQGKLRESPTRPSHKSTSVGMTQSGIGLADLDRDGHLDVVISPASGDPDFDLLFIYGIRESPSRFGPNERAREPAHGLATGKRQHLCIADLDGDGHADLAIGDPDFDLLRLVYTDDASVSPPLDFQQWIRESPTRASTGLVSIDMDRDGLLDIVTATTGGLDIRFQDSASPGRFLQPTTLAAGQSFVAVATGDVNGDGCPDLVATTSTTPVTFLRDPAAPRGFQPPILFPPPAPGGSFRALTLGDLDGDGHLDCVAIRESPTKASLGRGAGNGFFDVFTELDVAVSSPTGVAVGDLNGDGRPDLAVCGDGPDGSSVVLQDPAKPLSFTTPEPLRLQGGVRVAVGDVDGDGRLDVVTSGTPGCIVALQRPDVRGRFLPAYALSSVECAGLALCDLDRDGLLDVCFVEAKTGTLVCVTGDPDFDLLRIVSLNGLPPGVPMEGMCLAFGDCDGDGLSEIIAACPSALGALDGALFVFRDVP